MSSPRTDQPVVDSVPALMPQLKRDLARLVAIPSISSAGYPEPSPPLVEAYELVVELLRDAGVLHVGALELPDTAPVVTGEMPAPEGAPTVLLYSHYDVVPAGDESLWSSPPFEPTERDGALFGRGSADSKANIIMHVGALRAWEGSPPVGIKIVIEGQEEVGGGGADDVPAGPARGVRLRRDGDRRHGQRAPGRAHAHRRAARHGDGHDRGDDAGRGEAQRPVRRRRAGRADHAAARALDAARRERRRRRRGPAPRGVGGRVLHRRRVPRARRGAARAAA